MSGCPFEVGRVGLALTKTHMVVGAPRSYLATRASTLAKPASQLNTESLYIRLPDQNGMPQTPPRMFDIWLNRVANRVANEGTAHSRIAGHITIADTKT
jgi:hypothetical protein